jgi:hypothetical protein
VIRNYGADFKNILTKHSNCVITSRQFHLLCYVIPLVWGTLLVEQLVEALHYKLEGRGFDFRLCL